MRSQENQAYRVNSGPTGRCYVSLGHRPRTETELKHRYQISCEKLADLKSKGIAAGVYTQTTDVETEINGLMTYDRRVIKLPAEELRKFHAIVLNEE